MQKGDLLFVYGTLRQGERADLRKQAHNFGVQFLSKDKINGELYHIGSFPGVKNVEIGAIFNPRLPIIVGEVFRIKESALTAILDAYEGYNADNPKNGLYDRCQVNTERKRSVWVYTYNPPVLEEQLILGGDWCRSRQTVCSGRRLMG